MRLYDLTEQYRDVQDLAVEDPNNEDLQAMLDGLEGVIEDKVQNIGKVIASYDGDMAALTNEINRLQSRKSAINNAKDRLKEYAQSALESAGIDKVKGALMTVWLQNNPPSLQVLDDSLVPKEFFKTPEPIIQKREIMDAIKAGQDVPGVSIVQGRGIRFK